MSTPYWGPDFDALAAFDPDIAGVVTDELDGLRGGLPLTSENGELVDARPAYPDPAAG